jgi:hypothetical protein
MAAANRQFPGTLAGNGYACLALVLPKQRSSFDAFDTASAKGATLTLLATLVASYLILPAARAASTAVDVLWAALFNADVHFANSGIDYMGVATDPSPVCSGA